MCACLDSFANVRGACVSMYSNFNEDPADVQREWALFVRKFDVLLEENLRLTVKRSLQDLSRAINHDAKNEPPPLFLVRVSLCVCVCVCGSFVLASVCVVHAVIGMLMCVCAWGVYLVWLVCVVHAVFVTYVCVHGVCALCGCVRCTCCYMCVCVCFTCMYGHGVCVCACDV